VWITDLVHASVRLVREQAYRKGLTFSQTIDPAADVMMADERLLKQVLVTCSATQSNSPAVGHITLSVNANPESNTILIAVQDTGIGISPETWNVYLNHLSSWIPAVQTVFRHRPGFGACPKDGGAARGHA
jgi:C4-dicarboxylate-specific signal transduction histidine kinase